MPTASVTYINPETEARYMDELMGLENKQQFCLYTMMKIFHFIFHTRGISINDYLAEFVEDKDGNVLLSDIFLVDVTFPNTFEKSRFLKQSRNIGLLNRVDHELERSYLNPFEVRETDERDERTKKMFTGRLKSLYRRNIIRKKRDSVEPKDFSLEEFKKKLGQGSNPRGNQMNANSLPPLPNGPSGNSSFEGPVIQNTLGTSSFLTPSRKKAKILIEGGDWMNRNFSYYSSYTEDYITDNQLLELRHLKQLHVRGGKTTNIAVDKVSINMDTEEKSANSSSNLRIQAKRSLTLPDLKQQQSLREQWSWKPKSIEVNKQVSAPPIRRLQRNSKFQGVRRVHTIGDTIFHKVDDVV